MSASAAAARPRVLVLSDFYLPAFRAGGPVRSLAHLVERLGDRIDFRVVTSDRDLGARTPLPGVRSDAWQVVGGAPVYYASAPLSRAGGVSALLAAGDYDVLYLNSLFAPRFTLLPLLLHRLGRIPRRPVVLAPRGQLYPGALGHKRAKKLLFLAAARAAGLYRGVVWQATTAQEEEQLRRWFGRGATVVRAGNLAAWPDPNSATEERPPKRPGHLRIAYLSRISPTKNLAGALELLAGVPGEVELDAWGPHEDAAYVARCRELAGALPPRIRVRMPGEVAHADVERVLAGYHLFLLATKGENFGHAIGEALRAGCPVLISDRTPWRGLAERGVGWDLPLERPDEFRRVLRECVEMDGPAWEALAERARRYGIDSAAGSQAEEEALLRLFHEAGAERYGP